MLKKYFPTLPKIAGENEPQPPLSREDANEVADWFAANRGKFVFDRKTRTFRPQ